jgi:hypothetical protein
MMNPVKMKLTSMMICCICTTWLSVFEATEMVNPIPMEENNPAAMTRDLVPGFAGRGLRSGRQCH